MSQLVPPHIEKLEPYIPGRSIAEIRQLYGLSEVYKLASNENPLGVPPRAHQAMMQVISDVNRYGDPAALALRQKLATRFHLKPDNVAVGAGSEGIMSNIIRAFVSDRDELLTSEGTFIGFKVLAQSKGAPFIQVPLQKGYRFDLQAIADAVTEHTKVIYLCNPNNPTGTIFTRRI